jgi:hypothetical protein
MTNEDLNHPSQFQEQTSQLWGNVRSSVFVLTSSGHIYTHSVQILTAVSSVPRTSFPVQNRTRYSGVYIKPFEAEDV